MANNVLSSWNATSPFINGESAYYIHLPTSTLSLYMSVLKSYGDPFRVNSGSEEGGLPSINVFLTLTCQLQLTVVLVHIPVDTQ